MYKITFKHWKNAKELVEIGKLPTFLNKESSDRYVLMREDGTFVDIIKTTVVSIEPV